MATGNLAADKPGLWLGRCRRVQIESPIPVRVHVDGEFFCQPETGVRGLAIELLPGHLKVLAE
jgi:diacylglycerol kinase family enzyme